MYNIFIGLARFPWIVTTAKWQFDTRLIGLSQRDLQIRDRNRRTSSTRLGTLSLLWARGYTARRVRKSSPQPARSRRPFTPMRVSDGFRAFVLEQLAGVAHLRSRAMFGGVGLYAGEVFFGLLARDVLYLKVDAGTRGAYEAAGMAAFRPYADRPGLMSYFAVPADVLEDGDELARWAADAIGAARRASTPGGNRRVGNRR
jgi:DNA transformation protein